MDERTRGWRCFEDLCPPVEAWYLIGIDVWGVLIPYNLGFSSWPRLPSGRVIQHVYPMFGQVRMLEAYKRRHWRLITGKRVSQYWLDLHELEDL